MLGALVSRGPTGSHKAGGQLGWEGSTVLLVESEREDRGNVFLQKSGV